MDSDLNFFSLIVHMFWICNCLHKNLILLHVPVVSKSACEDRPHQKCFCCGSVCFLSCEHIITELLQFFSVISLYSWELTTNDLHDESSLVRALERIFESHKSIKYNTQWIYIGFPSVGLTRANLGTHVVRSSYRCFRHLVCFLRHTEVTQHRFSVWKLLILLQNDVGHLHVSVKHVAGVQRVKCEKQLHYPCDKLRFVEELSVSLLHLRFEISIWSQLKNSHDLRVCFKAFQYTDHKLWLDWSLYFALSKHHLNLLFR